MGVVVFAVADEAEERGHDELGAPAGAGIGDGLRNDAEAGLEVRAIEFVAGDAVADGLIGEIGAGKLAVIGGGVSVLVIGDDHDEGKFFDGGKVETFVKGARGSGTVAEAGSADRSVDAPESSGEESACDSGNHGTEVTDHGEEAFARATSVDIAIASAHGAEARTEVSACAIEERFTEGETTCLVANERGEGVATFEG